MSPRLSWLCLCLAAAPLPSCRTVQRVEASAASVVLPISQEKELGLQLQPEIEAKSKLLNDPQVIGFVRSLGGKVALASHNPAGWQFDFKVIDDSKTVNAFAIPGGTVYVYTGLLKTASDSAEVAGVLAHEVAHVTERHIAQRLVGAYGIQLLTELALGKNPGMVSQIAASIAGQGALLKNSRDQEAEADAKGVRAARQAGYDPQGLVDFFEKLMAQEGRTPQALTFLSDHPATPDRIRSLKEQIAREHLEGGGREPEPLRAIQPRLK